MKPIAMNKLGKVWFHRFLTYSRVNGTLRR